MDVGNINVKQRISQVNSKHCIPILQEVLKNEGITHGQLAQLLGLLPSGLSSVIKKMTQGEIPLLLISLNGKYREYRLPEYVSKYLTAQNEKEVKAKSDGDENLFLFLQRFVEIAGDNWKEKMNLLLQSEEIDSDSEEGKYFMDFMQQLAKQTKNDPESVWDVRAFLGNDVLRYLVDKYLDAQL